MKKFFFSIFENLTIFFQLNKKNRKRNRPNLGSTGITVELIKVYFRKKKLKKKMSNFEKSLIFVKKLKKSICIDLQKFFNIFYRKVHLKTKIFRKKGT